jgi:16S rRNA (guanine527-N7)-methyltransferase
MLTSAIEDFLAQGLERMGLSLDHQPEAISRLILYFQELKKWNRRINLVARSLDDQQILENHFLDSLTLLLLLPLETQEQETILDVGTGAGFPGLVLKAACPPLSITLVEPRKNRFYFLKHIIRTLDLHGIKVLDTRLGDKDETTGLSGRRFSFITSRAVTDMYGFVRLAAPFLETGGRIVLMKGPGAGNELHAFALQDMHREFFVAETRKCNLPFTRGERLLISVRESGRKTS